MNSPVKGILLNVEKNAVGTVTLNGTMDGFREALNCGYVDALTRNIGGKSFCIVYDEALNQWEDEPMLYGNLFIANIDADTETVYSLSEEDCYHVMSYIKPDGYRLHSTPKE